MKKDVKKGDIIKITTNSGNGHNYELGERYRVTHCSGQVRNMNVQAESLDGKWKGNSLIVGEFEIVGLTIEAFKKAGEDYKKKIEKIKSDIKENDDIIDWMTEMGIKEYDENEHRVFVALTAIEDKNLSKLEKSKLIGKLIKN
jgi:hypothetical protein